MPGTSATAKKAAAEKTPFKFNSLSGCYKNELRNQDFQDCARQAEQFCGPDSDWRQIERIDTRLDEDDTGYRTYGQRYCTPPQDSAATGGGTDDPGEAFTLDDIAELVTTAPRIHADNAGRGIRHAHTNFYTDAHVITEHTTLHGRPAILRAVPVHYRWDYGDGTTTTTDTTGTSHTRFNTPTATSHQYTDTGEYTVTLSTEFLGEYSLDGGQTWTRLEGTITRHSAPLIADIYRTVTRNVAEDCLTNPTGWGCTTPGHDTTTPAP